MVKNTNCKAEENPQILINIFNRLTINILFKIRIWQHVYDVDLFLTLRFFLH